MNSVGSKKFQGFNKSLKNENVSKEPEDMIAYNQVKKIPHLNKN
jgi:hypothetical protein